MADPQTMLAGAVSRAMVAALGDQVAGVDPVIRPTSNPANGDFQANFAMGLAKQLRRPPIEIAEYLRIRPTWVNSTPISCSICAAAATWCFSRPICRHFRPTRLTSCG